MCVILVLAFEPCDKLQDSDSSKQETVSSLLIIPIEKKGEFDMLLGSQVGQSGSRIQHNRQQHGSVSSSEIFDVVCSYYGLEPDDFSVSSMHEGWVVGNARRLYALLVRNHADHSEDAGEVAKLCCREVSDLQQLWFEASMLLDMYEEQATDYCELQCDLYDRFLELQASEQAVVEFLEEDEPEVADVVTERKLEYVDRDCNMRERIRRAAKRVVQIEDGKVDGSTLELRAKQIGVYADFAEFLSDAADDPTGFKNGVPTGRIILPPRTGKTVLAGQIVAGAGMMTTFIVPTRTLVEQASSDLREQLPGIPVGTYYGDEKRLVMWGINVTTYQILQARFREGNVPLPIALSSLVIADEAHRSMTVERQKVLREAFDRNAVRVALTATPNYSEQRRLSRYFECLIHEVSIAEAVELEMVAPLRVWIAEVDVDASTVELVAGDYDREGMGRIGRSAPFLEGARFFRYNPLNRHKPALMCCSSREQAYHLQDYLSRHRPVGTPEPVVVVGETRERKEILRRFEAGEIDTLINVGVLIEGWSSPRCKLLVDMALSRSWVRSAQKFFRPMTKSGEEEAHICMLIPKGLPELPILPLDLFEWNMPDYEQGDLIASSKKRKSRKRYRPASVSKTPVDKVRLRSSIVFEARYEKPKLDPSDLEQIRRVLESNGQLSDKRIPSYMPFRHLVFTHELFTGRGANLLRYCGVKMHKIAYVLFMYQFFPEAASDLYADPQYAGSKVLIDTGSCEEDREHMLKLLFEGGGYHENFACGWQALGGGDQYPKLHEEETPETEFLRERMLPAVTQMLLDTLDTEEKKVLEYRFGIRVSRKYTLEEVGKKLSETRERCRQIESKALRKLRHPSRWRHLKPFLEL